VRPWESIALASWYTRLVDEPTRGVDVGARREFDGIIRGLADRGVAVVYVASELAELQQCDRIVVMVEGCTTVEGPVGADFDEEDLTRLTFIPREIVPRDEDSIPVTPNERNQQMALLVTSVEETTVPPTIVVPMHERLLRFLGRYETPLVLAALLIIFSVIEGSNFMSVSNLQNVLVQTAIGMVIALGLTVVLTVGEFDMSIGYTASFAGMLMADNFSGGVGHKLFAIVLVVAVGALVGLLNGLVVAKLGVNALVGTLGVGSLVVGVNYLLTDGSPILLDPSGVGLTKIYESLWVFKWPIVILAVIAGIMWVLHNRTTLGLEIQAVGGNRTASLLSGIRVHRVVIMSFVICGMLAAVGGILITANIGSSQVTCGDGFLLESFAACFLGSATLRDGEFHVIGTVLGVFTIAVVSNGLAIQGVSASVEYLAQGALLIAAVGMSTAARRIAVSSGASH